MSSLSKKYVMALTGLVLFGFVVAHLLGNLTIFLGADWLNAYAEHLEELPIVLWPARAILLSALIAHMVIAIRLTIENKKARPIGYTKDATVQASLASRTMLLSGFAIFFFIIFHLLHFTFNKIHPEFSRFLTTEGHEDVYSMVILSFRDKWISLSYIAALSFLALHLSHGLSSFPQSLGLLSEKNLPCARKFAKAAALLIFLAYVSIPVCAWVGWLKPLQGL
jgi:succinate dehydrogenase / fumarate reductase cytochrome b subunit